MSSPRENQRHTDRSPLSKQVAERSWDWLHELCTPLQLEPQIIDSTLRPLLPSTAGAAATDGSPSGSGVDTAVVEALRTQRTQQVVTSEGVTLVVPLVVRSEALGALALSRHRLGKRLPPGGIPERLHQICAWLAAAVTRHLASAVVHAHDLAPLIRALEAGLSSGSDRELIAVFAEAMAVWHDVDVVGCIEVGQGTYVREVGIGAFTRSDEPVALPVEAIPTPLRLTPLSAADAEGLTPETVAEAVATTLTRHHGQSQWLLVFSGPAGLPDTHVLLNYIAALDMAMGYLMTSACAGVAATALRHAPGDRPSLRAALEAVLADVSARVSADAVVLVAEFPGLEAPVHLGSTDILPKPRSFDRSRLAVVRRGRKGEAVLLGIQRTGGRDFTPLERRVVETAAESVLAWGVPRATQPSQAEAASASMLERLAQDALEHGSAVTAVVLSTQQAGSSPSHDAGVDQVRRRLRQSDEVCVLRAGEVGVLLRDTTASNVAAVARRIETTLSHADDDQTARLYAIGFETRLPGTGAAAGIVQAARSNARRRSLDARRS
jgi:hypothetical protein